MVPVGPEGIKSFSIGYFEMAAAGARSRRPWRSWRPTPNSRKRLGWRPRNAKKLGFKIVYDKSYPPSTVDFGPVVRAVQAANPDIVYRGRLPAGQCRHRPRRKRNQLQPKMFGGAMIGMLMTPIRVQLGPVANGLVIVEKFLPSPKLQFPGLDGVMKRTWRRRPN